MKIKFENVAFSLIMISLVVPILGFVVIIVSSIPKDIKYEEKINLGYIKSTTIPNPESKYPDIQINCSSGKRLKVPLRYYKLCSENTKIYLVNKYTLLQRTTYYKIGTYLIPMYSNYRFIHWRKIPKQQQEPTYPL
jgi:hypothetical protein